METFNVDVRQDGGRLVVNISGYVNEHSKFPPLPESEQIHMDLGGVKGLNSVGTRSWCEWLKKIKASTKITLENCPVIYVKSFNQVRGSYPDNAHVLSFLVPYYSDATDERKDVLFKLNEHFGGGGDVRCPVVKDSEGKDMEVDVVHEIYFAFLQRL